MLNPGDVITIQYNPWSEHPITQTKKIVGWGYTEEGLWGTFGKTYSEQWDNASPLFRAIGWLDKGDIGCLRQTIAEKSYLILIKITNIQKLSENKINEDN